MERFVSYVIVSGLGEPLQGSWRKILVVELNLSSIYFLFHDFISVSPRAEMLLRYFPSLDFSGESETTQPITLTF